MYNLSQFFLKRFIQKKVVLDAHINFCPCLWIVPGQEAGWAWKLLKAWPPPSETWVVGAKERGRLGPAGLGGGSPRAGVGSRGTPTQNKPLCQAPSSTTRGLSQAAPPSCTHREHSERERRRTLTPRAHACTHTYTHSQAKGPRAALTRQS